MDGHSPELTEVALRRAADHLLAATEVLAAVSAHTAADVDQRLTPALLRVLGLVSEHPGIGLTALADRLRVSLSRASRMCGSLEQARLLCRTPLAEDRRGIAVNLTPEGDTALATVRDRRADWITGALLRMPPADLNALLAGLESLGPSLASRARDGI
ncbi:MarR family winged helix-turn-helix transcriptional regulator [Streptomyces cavernae]|uniref:MarR family winged helix-turn-helix transcriptional regulator n=1 Tax=Streptomyces cavernae TaxID=2259034 RepID=UPI001390B379|nr:MarR family transcriptional regulator [Streptomyces cavernae]